MGVRMVFLELQEGVAWERWVGPAWAATELAEGLPGSRCCWGKGAAALDGTGLGEPLSEGPGKEWRELGLGRTWASAGARSASAASGLWDLEEETCESAVSKSRPREAGRGWTPWPC